MNEKKTERKIIEIENVEEIYANVEDYYVKDNKLIINNQLGEKYSINYSFDKELDVYNRSNKYLNELCNTLKQTAGDKKLFGYVGIFFSSMTLAFASIASLATSILPLLITLSTFCVAYGGIGILYIAKFISLKKEYKNIKKRHDKLNEFLTFKKIDIDSKLYERQQSQVKEIDFQLEEIPEDELICVTEFVNNFEEIEDLENCEIEMLTVEQLKKLSREFGGKESKKCHSRDNNKRRKLV